MELHPFFRGTMRLLATVYLVTVTGYPLTWTACPMSARLLRLLGNYSSYLTIWLLGHPRLLFLATSYWIIIHLVIRLFGYAYRLLGTWLRLQVTGYLSTPTGYPIVGYAYRLLGT